MKVQNASRTKHLKKIYNKNIYEANFQNENLLLGISGVSVQNLCFFFNNVGQGLEFPEFIIEFKSIKKRWRVWNNKKSIGQENLTIFFTKKLMGVGIKKGKLQVQFGCQTELSLRNFNAL